MKKMFEQYKVVVFKKYATFEGRASQSEYWYFFAANFIIGFILALVEGFIGAAWEIEAIQTADESALGSVYSFLVLLPSIAAGVRRLHDSNKSGWWLLLPFYNLYLLIRQGNEGANRFGPSSMTPALSAIPPATPTQE